MSKRKREEEDDDEDFGWNERTVEVINKSN